MWSARYVQKSRAQQVSCYQQCCHCHCQLSASCTWATAVHLLETAWHGLEHLSVIFFSSVVGKCGIVRFTPYVQTDRRFVGHFAGPKKTASKKPTAKTKEAARAITQALGTSKIGQSATVSSFAAFATCLKPSSSACLHAAHLHILRQTAERQLASLALQICMCQSLWAACPCLYLCNNYRGTGMDKQPTGFTQAQGVL